MYNVNTYLTLDLVHLNMDTHDTAKEFIQNGRNSKWHCRYDIALPKQKYTVISENPECQPWLHYETYTS